jgi:hypothetical protein
MPEGGGVEVGSAFFFAIFFATFHGGSIPFGGSSCGDAGACIKTSLALGVASAACAALIPIGVA